MHYGTACPVLVHPSKNKHIYLAVHLRGPRIDLTPSKLKTVRDSASGEESMSPNERRIDQRVNVRVPLRFRILNGQESIEQIAESENISQRGIYFTTAVPLKVGMPLEVSLRMPQELAGMISSDVKCIARVVHIHSSSLMSGKVGIGLHIERYEAKASASERWMS
jgi:hypothetical protein